jgi:hypothetical protein
MHKTTHPSTKFRAERKARGFTVNKLQAVACLVVSVAVSVGISLLGR